MSSANLESPPNISEALELYARAEADYLCAWGFLLHKYMLNDCYTYSHPTKAHRVLGRLLCMFHNAQGATRQVKRAVLHHVDS